MRHGFIRPPLHFTPVPFAPYYSPLTARERARPRPVCVRSVIMFCFWSRRACARAERGCVQRGRRRDEEENGASVRCSHYTSCRFHLHLIVCLMAGDLPSLKRQLIPSPLARLHVLVCVCVHVCVCLCVYVQGKHSLRRRAVTHLWVRTVPASP